MNRAIILLTQALTPERAEEVAHFVSAEHFGTDPINWLVSETLPEDVPLHLQDQFEAEIKGRKLEKGLFFIVYGPESN